MASPTDAEIVEGVRWSRDRGKQAQRQLATIRRKQRTKQKALAHRIQLTHAGLSYFERALGDVKLSRFLHWCKALGVKPGDVLDSLNG